MTDESRREAHAYYDARAQSYFDVWGGENIHFGIYRDGDESLHEASTRATEEMYACLTGVPAAARVLDLGSGFGGAARFLAERGHTVTCIDMSEENNRVNRRLNYERGLDAINVVDARFERTGQADRGFDVVWSQEAICHSDSLAAVFREAWRCLRSGGVFALSNTCCGDRVSGKRLSELNERNALSLETLDRHSDLARSVGFAVREAEVLSAHLGPHYRRMLEELEGNRSLLTQRNGEEHFTRVARSLGYWLDACTKGDIAWGRWILEK